VVPNATNGVASSVDAWLDARAPDEASLGAIVADVRARAGASSTDHGVRLVVVEESASPAVEFDAGLRGTMRGVLGAGVPEVPTGAGHDAGILAAKIRTGMLFVRNPTGVSHSPAESASTEDCVRGVDALAAVLEALAWR
jgi:N-carbamoyl-L-amino-acid hydrolase